MKENLFHAHSCVNCRHSFYLGLGKEYASFSAISHKYDDSPTVYYCNKDKTCPCATQKEFSKIVETLYDPNSSYTKWFNLKEEDDPTSSTKFCGCGNMCCSDWEPIVHNKLCGHCEECFERDPNNTLFVNGLCKWIVFDPVKGSKCAKTEETVDHYYNDYQLADMKEKEELNE